MQLDRTRIAVRERGGVEILDMALHVVRAYFRPLLGAALWGAIPCALLNAALLWGMAGYDEDGEYSYRYVYLMIVLVFLEGPWAMVIVTQFLGSAVFEERTSVRQAARETLRSFGALLWCQGFLRGVIPGLAAVVMARLSGEFHWLWDGLALVAICGWAMWLRAFRPFINEIVLLEKNPLRLTKRHSPTAISAGRRSQYLHGPSGGDLVLRWIGASLVAIVMAWTILYALISLTGMILGVWGFTEVVLHFVLPAVLWLVAGFMAVVRFLNYLDLRIRVEGWEVELRLKAEAVRLASRLS